MSPHKEIWKPIPNWPEYEISHWGRIRNKRRGNIQLGSRNKEGYRVVRLSSGAHRRRAVYVHRLVAEAFIPEYSTQCSVRFHNGIRDDCTLENLYVDPYIVKTYRHTVRTDSRRVRIVELGMVFRNAELAAEHIRGDARCIYRCLRGEQYHHKGYTFEVVSNEEALQYLRARQDR